MRWFGLVLLKPMKSKTTCTVTYPLVSALLKADETLGPVFQGFSPVNGTQERFLEEFYQASKGDLSRFSDDEIESIASTKSDEVNTWLAKRGFGIKLNPFDEDGFGVATMLSILGEWAKKGTKYSVKTEDGEYYPGVKMTNYGLGFYRVSGSEEMIIEVETRNSDRVYLMMAEAGPTDLDLVEQVETIRNKMKPVESEYSGVVFPKVDLDMKDEIDWILQLRLQVKGGSLPYYQIAQALQQTKLKMNEIGFHVKSAVAIGAILSEPPKREEPYVINKPFLMWIERPQFAKPLFVAYLDTDVWKEPENLEM